MKGKFALPLILLPLALSLLGCGGTTTTNPPQMASLRVVQGNASIGNMNVAVDGTVLASNIAFLSNTGYLSVQAGMRPVNIQGNTNPPNEVITVNLAPGSKNTLVLDGWGTFSSGFDPLVDDTTAPAASSFKLRILDGALSTPGTMDVYVLPSGSLPGGSPTIAGIGFNNSPANYQNFTAGNYDVIFTSPGTTTVMFDSGPLSFASGQNRTFVLVNNCSQTTCNQNAFTFVLLADLN